MTEAQLAELTRALMRADPSMSESRARRIAAAIALSDTVWQDPLACSL